MDTKQIEAKITGLKRSGLNMQTNVHTLAIACLEHAQENDGDFTLMTKLYHALPQIVRRGTFVAWVKEYSPARFVVKKSKSGAKVKVFKKSKSEDANAFDIVEASNTPVHSFEAEKGTDEKEPLTCAELEAKVVKYVARLVKDKDASKLADTLTEQLTHSVA